MKYALLLLSLATASAQFSTDVRMVRLLVNVKNPSGDLVGSLDKKEFTVYDNSIPQEIAVFERYTTQPLSVALMIDVSGSTVKDMAYETGAIKKFLRQLFNEGNERDSAALFSFNYDVTELHDFTRRQQQLIDSMRFARGGGGTSLYDAIHLVSGRLQGRDGRHVLVIVSDGGNTTSTRKYDEALVAAQRADAIVYPIVVVPITNDAGRNLGGEHALQTLSASTGGRSFFPDASERLDQAFADILTDLRAQYLIAYYPRNLPKDAPRFHPVRVEMHRPDLRAFTRTGYYEEVSR